MHIHVTGTGPALVLIHGWALHGGIFAPLVQRLSPHFQLHVVDLPGHGFSRDDDTPLRLPYLVNAIAAATPPAVWCGWSLGGLVALHAAATLPQVRGLAMLAATPRFVRDNDWPDAVERSVFEQFGRGLSFRPQERHGEACEQREEYHLQHLAARQSAGGVFRDYIQKSVYNWFRLRKRGLFFYELRKIEARARIGEDAHGESQGDGERSRDGVVDHNFYADAPEFFDVADRARAADERNEHQRHDEHFDRTHEKPAR